MKKCYLFIGLALSVVITFVSTGAEAKELRVKRSFSGSFVGTPVDTNKDGQVASLSIVSAKGTLGPSTIQGVNEWVFTGPATCPNNNEGFGFTQLRLLPGYEQAPAHFVERFESSGDLIYSEQTAGTFACFDPATGIFFAHGISTITGGTGRFTNARGTVECSATAVIPFEATAGAEAGIGIGFGGQSGTCTGTIIIE